MNIKKISENEIFEIGKNKKNYVFGASDLGRRLVNKLLDEKIEVLGIWDNDKLKQGLKINGINIISYEELKKQENINLFLGCNYALQEEARIDALSGVEVYQIWGTKEDLKQRYNKYISYFPTYIRESERISSLFADDYSRKVNNALVKLITEYDIAATNNLITAEEHYFVKEVLDALRNRSPVCVDCGAFTGELPITMKKLGINFKKCFCFEMESKNCDLLRANVKFIDGVIIENSGVAETDGLLYSEGDSASSKIVTYETKHRVKTVKIDSYFKDINVDFIKMDIEGAELGALKGGISIIKRDRPVLAISVYHSLQDRTEILDYLYNSLADYNFYLRHHSLWAAETVLYGVPKGDYEKSL